MGEYTLCNALRDCVYFNLMELKEDKELKRAQGRYGTQESSRKIRNSRELKEDKELKRAQGR